MQIELRHLRKRFGKTVALDDVSLTIESGHRVALIGPNGSGKSTLTRAVMGLLACEGDVLLDGASPFFARARMARKLAYVPQIAPRLSATVGQLVEAIARVRELSIERIEATAAALALDIAALRKRSFRDLSGGMKQKLLLALALSSSASLLILDEPTASLDAASRRAFFRLYAEHAAGATLILCSHRLEEVKELADRVVALDQGIVVDDGAPSRALDFLEADPGHGPQ